MTNILVNNFEPRSFRSYVGFENTIKSLKNDSSADIRNINILTSINMNWKHYGTDLLSCISWTQCLNFIPTFEMGWESATILKLWIMKK